MRGWGCLGSATDGSGVGLWWLLLGDFGSDLVGFVEGPGVVGGLFDADPEQVGEATGISVAPNGFLEDPVLAEPLDTAGEVDGELYPASPDGFGACRGAEMDEQVGVGGVRPAAPVNRPGICGGIDSTERWRDASTTEVSR